MKKLEIELFRYESLVFGKVLKMDESLRGKGKIIANSQFMIKSVSFPSLSSDELFLRGNSIGNDNNMFYCKFSDIDTAIKVCQNIRDLVEEFNKEYIDDNLGKIVQIL